MQIFNYIWLAYKITAEKIKSKFTEEETLKLTKVWKYTSDKIIVKVSASTICVQVASDANFMWKYFETWRFTLQK